MSRGEGSVFLRGKIYWISYWFRGRMYQESSKSTDVRVARKLLRARLRKVDKPNFVDPAKELRHTIRDMKNILLTDYENSQRRSTASLKSCFKHVEKFFEFDRVADIDETKISAFTASMLKDGYERGSVNRSLAYLRHGLRLMFERRLISRVPVIKLLDGENVRQGFVTVGDMSALLSEIPDRDTRDIVEFLYASGWRSGEAMAMRWSWVDQNMIRLPAEYSKNKKPRLLPIVGTIAEVIDRRRPKRRLDCEFVFHREGKPIKFFRDSFKAAAKKVGLEQLPHDMRRSATRNFRKAGLSETVAMKLTGHRTRSIFDRYNIVSEDDLIEGMEKVAEHLKVEQQDRKVVALSKRKA